MKTTKINTLAVGLFLYATLFLGLVSQAAAPATFGVQGKLLDSEGVVVADGEYNFLIALGDDNLTEPTVYWPESGEPLAVDAVSVVNGVYNFEVGPIDPSILADNEVSLWLWVNEESMGPQGVQSVPYAIVAGEACSVTDGSITTDSLADGAVSLAKLDEGVGATLASVPALEGSLAETNDTVAAIGAAVDTLKETVLPTWTSGTNYVIVKGLAVASSPAFTFYGPSLYNPASGGAAAAPTIAIVGGELPPGVTYATATNTIGGKPTEAGVYALTLEATDFLGQTATQDVTITVLDVDLGPVTAETITGLAPGNLPHDGSVIAGDQVDFTFAAVDSSGAPVDISGLGIKWYQDGAPIASADSQLLSINARKFTTGRVMDADGDPILVNDEGTYSAKVSFSWGQTLTTDATYGAGKNEHFTLDTVERGFVIDTLLYDGAVVASGTVEAASNSQLFTIDRTFYAGFNGSARFQWWTFQEFDLPSGTPSYAPIAGQVYDTFRLYDARQILDGLSLTNGLHVDEPDTETSYFVVVNNTFADMASNMIELQVNDNINVFSALVDRREYAGYSIPMGISAITTNAGGGSLSYAWSWAATSGSTPTVSFGSTNSTTIPGSALLDRDTDLGDVDYNVTVRVTTVDGSTTYSFEDDDAEIIVDRPVLVVDANTDVFNSINNNGTPEDTADDFMEDTIGLSVTDGLDEVFFGIASPNDDNLALDESVTLGEDVTITATVYVPSANITTEDDGEYVAMGTGPERPITVTWYVRIDGQTTTMPASNVSNTYVWVDGAGLASGEASDRAGLHSRLVIDNAQLNDNNDANGSFWAVFTTPYGTITTDEADLVVVAP